MKYLKGRSERVYYICIPFVQCSELMIEQHYVCIWWFLRTHERQWLTQSFLAGEAQMSNRLSLCLKGQCSSILCTACTGAKISTVKMPQSSSRNDGSRCDQGGSICLSVNRPQIRLLTHGVRLLHTKRSKNLHRVVSILFIALHSWNPWAVILII